MLLINIHKNDCNYIKIKNFDDKDSVKYNENQYVLNKGNEEINDKKLQDNE